MVSSPVVGFVGSRSVGRRFAPLVAEVLASFPGHRFAVGCCVGADHRVLSLAVALGFAPRLCVFAAFGPGSAGASSLSAVSAVSAASAAGARVGFWAGGGPAVPLRARLAGRSRALVRFVVAGGPGSGLVAFLASPSSRGSLAACRLAAASSVPVLAFTCGFPGAPALLGPGGRWASRLVGRRPAWLWVPDLEVQLPLPLSPEEHRARAKGRMTGYLQPFC